MTELKRLTLAAAWMAAAVVAGLALSLVPNVEIITLTVFSGGVLLGSRTGAVIGFASMVLYVLANSAFRGFPPSPLPLLLAQAVGMSAAGFLGGVWKRFWMRKGIPQGKALFALPLMGILSAALFQIVVNGVSARLFSTGEDSYFTVFWAGMSFGFVQIVANAVVFTLLAPQVALTLRRLARRHELWILAILLMAAPASAQEDTGTTAAPPTVWRPVASPLWDSLAVGQQGHQAQQSFLEQRPLQGLHLSQSASTFPYRTGERWGWGWGRVRMEYDGLPLNGPLHGVGEPPDIPQAFLGQWYEAWGATGTRLHLTAPPRELPTPVSELILSTGSFARRTVEVALFRNLGPVNLGLDLADLEQASSDFMMSQVDLTRFWFHLDSGPGHRPNWSLDWSSGRRDMNPLETALYRQYVRRLQVSLRGPLGSGEARLAAQARRQALRTEGDEEVRVRGATLAAEWQFSPRGQVRLRGAADDRRGILETRTFWGGAVEAEMGGRLGILDVGLEGSLKYQEPWGNSPEGRLVLSWKDSVWTVRGSMGTEAGAPPLVDLLDRPGAVQGLSSYLEIVETLEQPERTSAVRLEGAYRDRLVLGTWFGRQTGYVLQSNPLWSPSGSDFRPVYEVGDEAEVAGVYGTVRVPLFWNLTAEGTGRVHNRDLRQVPYLPQWSGGGDLTYQAPIFGDAVDFRIAVGGELWGERLNPNEERYEYAGLGHLSLEARVENGGLFLKYFNITSNAAAADYRFMDSVTPFAVAGYHWMMGINMVLSD